MMVNIRQLLKNPRKPWNKKNKRKDLMGCPQKKAVCFRVFVTTPRKPNSALRKVARVTLTTRKKVTAYIPGKGHTLQKHSVVLVRGGRAKDLPGSKYKLVRGKYDLKGVLFRNSSRSKYGIKRP